MDTGKKWWAITVVAAFASVISFFQVNSYKADLLRLNTLWLVAGIVIGLFAVYALVKAVKNMN